MLVHKSRSHHNPISGNQLLILFTLAVAFLVVALLNTLPAPNKTNPNTEKFRTYQNSDFHYSLSYPSSCKITPQAGNSAVLTIASSFSPPETAGGPYSQKGFSRANPASRPGATLSKIDIVAYTLDVPMSAPDFLRAKSTSVLDGKISPVKVAGQDGLQVEVTSAGAINSPDQRLLYRNVFVTKGYTGFIIAGLADQETFNQIHESIQVNLKL